MKITRLMLVLFAIALTPAVWAQCTINVHVQNQPQSGEPYQLSWDPVPGADFYTYTEKFFFIGDEPEASGEEKPVGATTAIELNHLATQDVPFIYVVRAYSSASPLAAICSGSAIAHLQGDTELRTKLNRGVLPIVGSAPGAYGARFKTYLRLSGRGSGTLIFHPLGQAALDTDPSMHYELTDAVPALEWDDVVAAIGTSGIGSLDIVPDLQSSLPVVDARVYNDSPEGRFGSAEFVYLPSEFFEAAITIDRFPHADAGMRVNIGARTLYPRTHAIVSIITPEGKVRGGLAHTFQFKEVGTYMQPLAFFGLNVLPGDTISVVWDHPVIPFHTLTDNKTNDPFIYVGGRGTSGGVNPAFFIK